MRANGIKGFVYLHPYCTGCRQQLRSAHAEHELYTPELHRRITDVCHGARSGSRPRGIVWALEPEDVLGLYLDQGGRCALSGVRMTFEESVRVGKDWTAPSIDRIDSSRNYTLDNVHLVCVAVNIMKNELPMGEFVTWCAKVTAKIVYGENL